MSELAVGAFVREDVKEMNGEVAYREVSGEGMDGERLAVWLTKR